MNSLSELKSKVRALLDSPSTDREFVDWLGAYAKHAKELLDGNSHQQNGLSEIQRRDLISSLSRFNSDQKAIDWAHEHKITLGKGVFWWWLNPDNRTGKIVGLDNSAGYPRITNGIDVWIERFDGSIFLGHRDWLKYDRRVNPASLPDLEKVKGKDSPVLKACPKYLDLAKDMIKNNRVLAFVDKYQSTCSDSESGTWVAGDVAKWTPEFLSTLIDKYITKKTENVI